MGKAVPRAVVEGFYDALANRDMQVLGQPLTVPCGKRAGKEDLVTL